MAHIKHYLKTDTNNILDTKFAQNCQENIVTVIH